jgi:hypothetical protein
MLWPLSHFKTGALNHSATLPDLPHAHDGNEYPAISAGYWHFMRKRSVIKELYTIQAIYLKGSHEGL